MNEELSRGERDFWQLFIALLKSQWQVERRGD